MRDIIVNLGMIRIAVSECRKDQELSGFEVSDQYILGSLDFIVEFFWGNSDAAKLNQSEADFVIKWYSEHSKRIARSGDKEHSS